VTNFRFITSKVNKAKTSLPTVPHHRQRRSLLPVSEQDMCKSTPRSSACVTVSDPKLCRSDCHKHRK